MLQSHNRARLYVSTCSIVSLQHMCVILISMIELCRSHDYHILVIFIGKYAIKLMLSLSPKKTSWLLHWFSKGGVTQIKCQSQRGSLKCWDWLRIFDPIWCFRENRFLWKSGVDFLLKSIRCFSFKINV